MPEQTEISKRRKTPESKAVERNGINFSCFVLLRDIFKGIKVEREEDDNQKSVQFPNTIDSIGKTTNGVNIKDEKEDAEEVLSFDGDYEYEDAQSDIVKEEERFCGELMSPGEILNECFGEMSPSTISKHQQLVSRKILITSNALSV